MKKKEETRTVSGCMRFPDLGQASLTFSIERDDLVVLDGRARDCHPGSDCCLPGQIVGGLLVCSECVLVAVDLVEEEEGWVCLGLVDIKTDISGLLTSAGSVLLDFSDEVVDVVRNDVDSDCNSVHISGVEKERERNQS